MSMDAKTMASLNDLLRSGGKPSKELIRSLNSRPKPVYLDKYLPLSDLPMELVKGPSKPDESSARIDLALAVMKEKEFLLTKINVKPRNALSFGLDCPRVVCKVDHNAELSSDVMQWEYIKNTLQDKTTAIVREQLETYNQRFRDDKHFQAFTAKRMVNYSMKAEFSVLFFLKDKKRDYLLIPICEISYDIGEKTKAMHPYSLRDNS